MSGDLPPTDPRRPPHVPERFERTQGARLGDTRYRVVRRRGFRRRPGVIVATEEALESPTVVGRAVSVVREILFGKRISSDREGEERLGKVTGLAIFASDNISSSAYATEETMRSLALAGAAGLALTMPLTIAIIVILAIVVTSYLQVIRAYPNGGGSYIVASQNLGMLPGLLAASALLVDYVLTVSVSVAAGVLAITTAFPGLDGTRVAVGVLFIVLLTIGNLRGIREAGVVFAGPTYIYVAGMAVVLAIGFYRVITGDVPTPVAPPQLIQADEALGAFLILRAFSSGSVGLSGTEAVANGVPAFREPAAKNASAVLIAMGTLFGVLFFGISFLATHLGIRPDATETKSVVGLLTQSIVGEGPLFYLVQASTAIILVLAANTSFSGFPRLASILATDRFMPRQFAQRGDRLAYSFGILVLAVVSALLLVVYDGSVNGLIPLYTIGVFIAFTLSQAGLVRFWLRERTSGWRFAIGINGAGAVVTAIVTIVVAVTKFALGAWLVLAVLPLLIYTMWRIRRHYQLIEDELLIPRTAQVHVPTRSPRIIVPVARLDRSSLNTLSLARAICPDVSAVHISYNEEGAAAFRERWIRVIGPELSLEVIVSPYRALVAPFLSYLDAIDAGDRDRPVIVAVAEFVPDHWWEAALHNQTALHLKIALFARKNTAVINVPFHPDDPDEGDGSAPPH